MPIELSLKQSLAWEHLEDLTTTEVGYGGAAGGGKSYFGCVWHVYRRMTYPESRGLIGRAKLSALRESTLVTLFKVCSDMGYKSGEHFKYNGQDHTILWANGSKTILKDLFLYPSDPDFTSLGSTEYTDAFIDEATEITERAFDIVNSRLRWKISDFGLIPKTLITCNPSPGWVKNRYIVDDKRNSIVLKPYQKFVQALVTDNPDENFKALYIEQLEKLTSDFDRQRLLYGDWEAEREVLNRFATQYDVSKHESTSAVFRPQTPIIFIFDFNLNPFSANLAHIWRDEKGEHCHIFAEISIDAGSIDKMCDYINSVYGKYISNSLVTGDSMGKRRDLGQRDNASHYQQIQRLLGMSKTQFRLPNNPTHENSRADTNYLLAHFPDFKINPQTCPNTCRDMRVVQCDAFGSIIKKSRNDLTQQSDHLDNVRYLVHTFLKPWINADQKTIRK